MTPPSPDASARRADATRRSYAAVRADWRRLLDGRLEAAPPDRAGLGAEVSGIDLSPGMVTVARGAFPALRFEVGSTNGLGLPDGSLGGALSRYSTAPMDEPEPAVVRTEFACALAPGGLLRAPSR